MPTPEERARQKIDEQLAQCGWIVQNASEMNISAGLGTMDRYDDPDITDPEEIWRL